MISRHLQRIHMIGIGGAGMSPLAELLHHYGYIVTGSDRTKTDVTLRLESIGIRIQYNHNPVLIKDAQLVVYSSAIKEDNEERLYALKSGKKEIRRAELLGDLMRLQKAICISGTHGKTTTTSLIGLILLNAGLNPTLLTGGILPEKKSGFIVGEGKLMVVEADEFDRSFLSMYPTIALITNIDNDHLDCYNDINEIKEAFISFANKVPFYGELVVCIEDKRVREILPYLSAPTTTYGFSNDATIQAINVRFVNGAGCFEVLESGKKLGEIILSLKGEHNILNSLGAISVARIFNIDFRIIRDTLASFKGVHRRFEIISDVNDIKIIDDYAHHPSEILATVNAARRCGAERVVSIFQPHLYSRTQMLLDDFVKVLKTSDIVYVCDIYASREKPVEGVNAVEIVKRIREEGNENSFYIEDMKLLPEKLYPLLKRGDYVLFMGAGDINTVAYKLAEKFYAKA